VKGEMLTLATDFSTEALAGGEVEEQRGHVRKGWRDLDHMVVSVLKI